MLAIRLVRLIENHIEQLSRDLSEKVWNSSRCSDLSKVPASELQARTREIYRNLSDWLLDKTEAQVERRYTELGPLVLSRAWPTAASSGRSSPPRSTCASSSRAKVSPIAPWNCTGSYSSCSATSSIWCCTTPPWAMSRNATA
jgi:hypothetical protein